MQLKIEHELTREEKEEIINEMSVDEVFDLIKTNIGTRSNFGSFTEDEIVNRILDDYSGHLVSTDKIGALLEQLPDKDNCKTSVEAFVVQELNEII